jgi:vanillate O-demethylase ferredoxin subunit
MAAARDTLLLRVHAITYAAPGIHLFELRHVAAGELPAFTAGAHIDVHLANGLVRQYSLVNAPHERHRYLLGIKWDPASRGGSAWIHQNWRVGDTVHAGMPRNHFPLDEAASHSVLVAGGIGITPMLAMSARLQTVGLPWRLHYAVRTRADAVPLEGLDTDHVDLHADDERGGVMDVAALVAAAPAGAHLYCCGPAPMIDRFEVAATARPAGQVHVERFAPTALPATTGGFHVELARRRRRVFVPHGCSIADALRAEGIEVQTSCEQGICGTCETRVLAGRADHRDMLLSAEEKAANRVMMLCCSGSLDETLVLDL